MPGSPILTLVMLIGMALFAGIISGGDVFGTENNESEDSDE